jgi:DNA-binding transcriptional ArsR family regulator
VKVWQDELVTERSEVTGRSERQAGQYPAGEVRAVTSVDTLKAMADPLRLAILAALMRDTPRDLRILSVKELAAELGEPKTKLYRHIKQLESAGLIRVASTRLVSGILEQRYQACQGDLTIGSGVMRDPGAAGEAASLVAASLDHYRGRYLAYQAGLLSSGDRAPGESYRRPVLTLATTTVSPEVAKAVRGKLQEVIDLLSEPADDSADGVPVEVLIGFLSPG